MTLSEVLLPIKTSCERLFMKVTRGIRFEKSLMSSWTQLKDNWLLGLNLLRNSTSIMITSENTSFQRSSNWSTKAWNQLTSTWRSKSRALKWRTAHLSNSGFKSSSQAKRTLANPLSMERCPPPFNPSCSSLKVKEPHYSNWKASWDASPLSVLLIT